MAGNRLALLIATDQYTDSAFRQLCASRHDAIALAKVLADTEIGGYQVSTLENRSSHEIRLQINKLFAHAGRNDLVLLYFSGHGIKDAAGRLHLATTDTQRLLLAATTVSAQFIREIIDYSSVRRVVVWLDCCYGGAFPAGMVPKAEGAVDVLPQLAADSGRGCAVMTASTNIQFAFEPSDQLTGDPQPSVFTRAIVKGLSTGEADLNADGEIDAYELYEYVYNEVTATRKDQTPTRNDQVTGDLYIARSKRGIRLHLDLPAEIKRNLRSTRPQFRLAAVQELDWLATYGDAHLRKIADETLSQLRVGSDWYLVYAIEQGPSKMITREEAEQIAEKWVADSSPDGISLTATVHEFDMGYVVWGRPPPGSPPLFGASRGIIDRYTGELSVWPSLPVEMVIAQYRSKQASRPPTLWTWSPAEQARWDQRHVATPTNITHLLLSGRMLISRSVKGDREPRHHPLVLDFFRNSLPPEYRERGYNRCAEAAALSDALHAEDGRRRAQDLPPITLEEARNDLFRGASMETYRVRESGDPMGGKTGPPCISCAILCRHFGFQLSPPKNLG
jgi:hypothetical protein